MAEEVEELPQLKLKSTIGFQGKIKNGLIVHPDISHIVYAEGQTVMVRHLYTKEQYGLHGHTNTISCLSLSRDGSLIASGQTNFMGFKADVIIWDFKCKRKYGSHNIHKVKVEAVSFNSTGRYVVSVGGQDCRSVVVWDVNSKQPLCGSPSSQISGGYATLVCCANMNANIFVTAGRESLRMWKLDTAFRRVTPINIHVGQIKREIKCIEIDSFDKYLYCGTTSGDILKVSLNLQTNSGDSAEDYKPKLLYCLAKLIDKGIVADQPLYSMGVTAIAIMKTTGDILIGTGNGIFIRGKEIEYKFKEDSNRSTPSTKPTRIKCETRIQELGRTLVQGTVTAIGIHGSGHEVFVATRMCEIYRVKLLSFECQLMFTCHDSQVNDVVFPYRCSELFATCGTETIRIWNVSTSQELLRICVPNMICNSVNFMQDGRSIISGWNDGKIRGHTPETGKIIYIIEDAHQRGVTAIAGTSDSLRIVSGGGEGDVRLWDVSVTVQILKATMKEHKGAVTSVHIKSNDLECVTSGADGSCIIWDLIKFLRIQVVFANTLFQSVCYGPEECQIITCGSDRKIGYWEVFDGTQIRELDGSMSGTVNALDISEDCETFVSGGCDKLLKVWKYQEGIVTHVGLGHSDDITAVRISPKNKHIISVGKDGAIFIWEFPK